MAEKKPEDTTQDPSEKGTDAMTTEKKIHKVGDAIMVKPAGIVIRPDGSSHIVIRGVFYLDQRGKFLVEGTEVTVE